MDVSVGRVREVVRVGRPYRNIGFFFLVLLVLVVAGFTPPVPGTPFFGYFSRAATSIAKGHRPSMRPCVRPSSHRRPASSKYRPMPR